MKRRAASAGIAGRMTWKGQQPKSEVLAAYRAADVFALASRIAGDGDRDGLPNVLTQASPWLCASIKTLGRPSLSPSSAMRLASGKTSAAR